MNILVLNAGSSSLKCRYFKEEKDVASVTIERIGENESYTTLNTASCSRKHTHVIKDHHQAIDMLFSLLKQNRILSDIGELDAVGHRVVHGGAHFSTPVLIDREVIETIRSMIPLAPLHNPANLNGIESIAVRYPSLPQVAVFDTAFHQTMPRQASCYPLPYDLYETYAVRRNGFHGTSHAYVGKAAAKVLKVPPEMLHLITLHLGNGASGTAVKEGKSIDTSMGMTPLEGLMMGTRCGDIDPAIIPYLMHERKMTIEEVDSMLNKESGLKGICGTNDMRDVIARSDAGDEKSRLALEMYVYRIKKYIGSYIAVLGRLDALVFTGGIGEHASKVRKMVCAGLEETFGIILDEEKNAENGLAIHHEESKVKILVIPTDEELEIARQTQEVLSTAGHR